MSAHVQPDVSQRNDPQPLVGIDDDFGFGRSSPPRERDRIVNAAANDTDPLVGATVADVVLQRVIGEGGMGRVYLARQLRPDRAVAVKLLKPGMLSAGGLRRFERESQVLASLQHPGIAHIHSFGTFSAAGTESPYIVMEYIDGAKPVTEYAEDRGLTSRERLQLFREVCNAVSHAHSRGILHRDLKPGNILVAADGQPKIIDFGVARQLDRDTILTTAHEDIGRLIGTIQYMAPEQFRGAAREMDVRIDVYSLGVVLYELLTGRPPHDLRRAVLAEAARVVLEEEPQPLSFHDRALNRDVGRIARKCLEKNPQHRYASAVDLACDIGRYLEGEPVLARPPSLADRLARACRRHRVALAFVAGTLTVLVSLLAWSLLAAGTRGGGPAARPRFDAGGDPPRPPLSVGGGHEVVAPERLLDVADVQELRPKDGYLSVNCRALTPEAAAVLAGPICHLTLELREIDVDVARALAAQRDGLSIAGIRSLRDDVAAAIAGHRGGSLVLDDVESLSQAAAVSLAGYGGWLNLAGIDDWAPGALEAIVRHKGGLAIRVAGLSPEQARTLAEHRGPLYVIGIDGLDAAVAGELVRHDGPVDLWKAEGITPEAEVVLRQHARLRFPGR